MWLKIVQYKKILLFIILIPFILPIFNILIEIIFKSGTIIGSIVRNFN